MNKKISLGLAVGILILAVAVSSAVTMGIVNKEYNNILKGLPEKLERYEILDELDGVIKNNYYSGSDEASLKAALAGGYVAGLKDPFSKFMTADEYAEYISGIQGNMYGIGIKSEKTSDNRIKITAVYSGSPAKSSGLRAGDIIIAFDGIMLDANNYDELSAKLEGDKLTAVNLTYKRNNTETTVNIIKGYEAQSVLSKTYGNVGYIKINEFYSTTANQVEAAVESLTSSKVSALVIDVRNNSSTNYENAMDALDIFVPVNDSAVPAASVLDSKGNVVEKFVTTAGEVGLPVAVLINEKTEAAAELFACNIRDFSKGALVGTKTKGVALVPKAFKLTDGNAVLLSVGIVRPYKSETFNSSGLTPDKESVLKSAAEDIGSDSQFLDAVALLTESE